MSQKQINIKHHGDHHDINVKCDPKNGEVSGFSSMNFGNNSLAVLKYQRKKLFGEFSHTGKTHRFNIKLNPDGTYDGNYIDKKKWRV